MAKICPKCQQSFKTHQKIKGIWRNLKKRKFCLNCSPFGAIKRLLIVDHALMNKLNQGCNY
jgi:hypothetical protein